jgi:hypothetical protein
MSTDMAEHEHLETMYRSALALAETSDPLLRGQCLALLGRVTALMAITRGELPPVLEDTAGQEGGA